MPKFRLDGNCQTVLARLFETHDDGRLGFTWGAQSLHPAKVDDLIAGPVRFRDYLMEGFIYYSVQAEDLAPGCLLSIRGEASNRDQYLASHGRHFIKVTGIAILAEADD